MQTPESVIAVFELRPYWGPELQRQFEHTLIAVRECRCLADLLLSVNEFESALIVIDFDAAPDDCLKWLGSNIETRSRRVPIIACGSAATKELEWVIREFGVTAFLPDVIPGDEFARLCRRQLGLRQ